MKVKLLICLLFYSFSISAQLVITSGEHLFISGNTQLTINNTNLINNGSFTAGNSRVSFTGNNSSTISGNKSLGFFDLELNKTSNNNVTLQRAINVTNRIICTAGYLNPGGFNIDLGTTGRLDGEKESSRIRGNSGEVLSTAYLNSPSNANPGNLGAVISSSRNLGNVTIKRGHQSQSNNIGSGNSILRYYDISPSNNNNLNATLRFNYFEGELNGHAENTLVFINKTGNSNWTAQGYSTRNPAANYVEKTGIRSLSRWSLASVTRNSFNEENAKDIAIEKIKEDEINVSPNPFHDYFLVNIYANQTSTASLRLFDSKGMLIKQQVVTIQQGNNQSRFETGLITNGVYTLQASWNDQIKVVRLVKQ